MKKNRLTMFVAAISLLAACDNEIKDIPKTEEKLTLTPSATSIALDADNMQKEIITFNWTAAREMKGEYAVSYTTKLDLVGNNFGSSTVIMNYENDGDFSRGFTSAQLNNWANEKWKQKVNKPFTLEFRVVAEWEGGSTFEAPEVRTVTVEVQPIKVEVFAADHMYIDGSVVDIQTEMQQTVENESQYAWYGELTAGELQIPVDFEGDTYYIVPKDGKSILLDGQPQDVKMQETPISWNIPKDGNYRVVVNMEKTAITIYSPEKPLAPDVVTWMLDGVEQTTEVNKIWHYGEPTGWGWKDNNWTQSMADPQIFIYSGPAITGRTKFGVEKSNVCYVYAPNTESANTSVTHGVEYDLIGGYTGGHRNAYFQLPAGTNFIILDIRNKTMKAFKK
ncbi:SusE domain-containing protein [Bacteroides sp. 519]|uniref:SusE domain-containing protein n=1 Tax=Bacteroides sp. 519 TaxID=2302937 RepID=UPI0013D1192E|nr:SusE domain-containing protein [Bacteroides sp. 519]NDV59235.1 hypothetical protein [Bacteroides sp. 519]